MAVINMLGAAQALLLLAALLPAGARADNVTFRKCRNLFIYNTDRVISLTEPAEETDNGASTLNLMHCQITEISGVVFIRRPNLIYIYYNHNNIQNVDPIVFSGAPQIRYLYFNNNSLTSVPVFGEAGVLPKVGSLGITHNKIKRLDNSKTFSSMKDLRNVYLKNNFIEYISPDIFHGLPRLDTVDLSYNELIYISDNTFAIPSLKSVDLANNKIEYISPGAFSGTSIDYLYLSGNKLTHLPEHFVASLTRTGGKLNYFLVHDNPFQCGCLSELLAEVEQLDNCKDVVQPTCVQPKETQCVRLSEVEYIESRSTEREMFGEKDLMKKNVDEKTRERTLIKNE